VISALAALFKVDKEQLRQRFERGSFVFQIGLSLEQARHLQVTLAKHGCLSLVEPEKSLESNGPAAPPPVTVSNKAPSHYDVLEVSATASTETVRSAYASLAERSRELGNTPVAHDRHRQLDTAFVVLSDSNLRNQFDEQLAKSAVSPVQALAENEVGPRRASPFDNSPRSEIARAAFAAENWGGFWRRLVAHWIDDWLWELPAILLLALAATGLEAYFGGEGAHWTVVALILGSGVLYHGLFIGSKRISTPGRMAVALAVVDAETGVQIGRSRAFLRSLVSIVGYPLVIPNLVMLFTARRQTVADLLARTVVVKYRSGGNGIVIGVVVLFVGVALVGILAAIAIPAYQDYTVRATVVEGLQLANNAKEAIERSFESAGVGLTDDASFAIENGETSVVSNLHVVDNSVIQITFGAGAGAMNRKRIYLIPKWTRGQRVTWICAIEDSKLNRFVPQACRK